MLSLCSNGIFWDFLRAQMVAPIFRPLYQQIKMLITRQLEEGEWKPGQIIPSETELALRYKVSQGTVRKAIDALAADNLLVRRQGKGTFVATHHEENIQFRFLKLMPNDGVLQTYKSNILECKKQKPPANVAAQLEMKAADFAIQIKRLLEFSSGPTVFDQIWLPRTLFTNLTFERLNQHPEHLYSLFETDFGVRMVRAEEKITAVSADQSLSEWLLVPENAPLLRVERLSFTYGNRPVELRRGWYVTSHFHYANAIY